ncbi:hypothetical protein JZX86_27670 [Agrobacterium rosae]|uniref:hypothetical protein n=1 Tax=Agrobacterium rosae TaxID=1972867 RepID=UPI0019D34F1F|nr:hypothetical protein [Agrobacterium rosae]MBN7809102.1 hypothetical protein [Agrobacterium rosae]
MKIHVDIANGYKQTHIKQLMLDNPAFTDLDATTRFIDSKYSAWIKRKLGNDFTIFDITEDTFRIDFTYEDDANAFVKQVGGRVIEEADGA